MTSKGGVACYQPLQEGFFSVGSTGTARMLGITPDIVLGGPSSAATMQVNAYTCMAGLPPAAFKVHGRPATSCGSLGA